MVRARTYPFSPCQAETDNAASAWTIGSNDPFNYSFVQNTSFPVMLIGNTAGTFLTNCLFFRRVSSVDQIQTLQLLLMGKSLLTHANGETLTAVAVLATCHQGLRDPSFFNRTRQEYVWHSIAWHLY